MKVVRPIQREYQTFLDYGENGDGSGVGFAMPTVATNQQQEVVAPNNWVSDVVAVGGALAPIIGAITQPRPSQPNTTATPTFVQSPTQRDAELEALRIQAELDKEQAKRKQNTIVLIVLGVVVLATLAFFALRKK